MGTSVVGNNDLTGIPASCIDRSAPLQPVDLSKLLRRHGHLLVTDYRTDYLQELCERWEHLDQLHVAPLDLTAAGAYEVLREFKPDTIVCLNVLEHIEDDRPVLRALSKVLTAGCRMVFLVPFNPKLFSELDLQIGHYRRHEKGELEGKLTEAGFTVERQFFFNKVGVMAWWVGNKLTGQRTITSWQLKMYNFLTPLFRRLDRLLPISGPSTIVVARR